MVPCGAQAVCWQNSFHVTPCTRVIPEKLRVAYFVNKFNELSRPGMGAEPVGPLQLSQDPPSDPIVGQTDSVHIFTPYLFQMYLNIVQATTPVYPKCLLPFWFQNTYVNASLVSAIRATFLQVSLMSRCIRTFSSDVFQSVAHCSHSDVVYSD